MNHDHLKSKMVPLPDPKVHGDRPGYDASQRRPDQLQIVETIKPEQLDQLDPNRHLRFADRVWYHLFKKFAR